MISDCNLWHALQKNAIAQPSKIALSFEKQSITYKQLYSMVGFTAEVIYKSGAKPGDIIIVFMENSIDMIVSFLASLCNRCTVLPIDSELPAERIRLIIQDSNPKIILCNTTLLKDRLDSIGYGCILVDEMLMNAKVNDEFIAALRGNQIDDNAFCIYTSGTTGSPKGVLLNYRGIINHANAKIELLSLSNDVKMCLSFNVGFVASIWQIITPIYIGGQLIICRKELIKNPYAFFSMLQTEGLNFVAITPHTLRGYLEYIKHRNEKLPLTHIRQIVLTGEKIDATLVKEFYREYSDIQLVNAYGQTECSDDTYHYVIPTINDNSNVPIGKPIFNMYGCVLDESFNEVGDDETGELYIGGIGVATGYMNNEKLSREKFVFLPERMDRFYRTGDIVKKNLNGDLIYVGRKDNQVKIRGHRIELEEVETYLKSYPDINQAIALQTELNGTNIIQCVFTSNVVINKRILFEFFSKHMPKYMIPSRLIQISEFVYTPNGKINRQYDYSSLAVNDELDSADEDMSDLQICIFEVIKPFLTTEAMVPNMTIEMSGIDSISFVRMVIQLEDAFDFEFDDYKLALSEFSTILELIQYVERKVK